jgi:hypothetical protein
MITEIDVTLVFTEPLLGSQPGDEEIFTTYMLGKRNEIDIKHGQNGNGKEEVALLPAEDDLELKRSVFLRAENGDFVLSNHLMRGFFKYAAGALKYMEGTHSQKLTMYKHKISQFVWIDPRFIVLRPAGAMYHVDRPLRRETPFGPATALASSEALPANTSCKFTVQLLGGGISAAHIEEWLKYGKYQGLGQWRGASYGRFRFDMSKPRQAPL